MREKIQALAGEIFGDVVAVRRHLHANPELSFEELETARFVAERLRALNVGVDTGVGGNGVVGHLRGSSAGSAWRCALTWMRCRSGAWRL